MSKTKEQLLIDNIKKEYCRYFNNLHNISVDEVIKLSNQTVFVKEITQELLDEINNGELSDQQISDLLKCKNLITNELYAEYVVYYATDKEFYSFIIRQFSVDLENRKAQRYDTTHQK